MKKYFFSMLAVLLATVASSVTSMANKSSESNTAAIAGYRWYNYNGTTILGQTDPSNYSLDENNFPDCPPNVGIVYCEIYAQPSQWVEGDPNLFAIGNCRMKPLL